MGFHDSAAAMPAPFMAIVEPRLMMRVPLETTWPRAFVALAGCVEGYVAGRGFVPDLLRCGAAPVRRGETFCLRIHTRKERNTPPCVLGRGFDVQPRRKVVCLDALHAYMCSTGSDIQP